MLGYDTVFFEGGDDSEIVYTALSQNRIIVTRDTCIVKRRLITSGKVRAVLLTSESSQVQVRQVLLTLDITGCLAPFTRCMECNALLEEREKEEIKERYRLTYIKHRINTWNVLPADVFTGKEPTGRL
jgi:uncharacterized protein with PIN domain